MLAAPIRPSNYELKRGTPPRKSNRGRIPGYIAKRGQEAYAANRKRSKRPCKIDRDDCEPFIQWMCERIRKDRWSIDGCVGAARLMKSFPGRTIPCTKTLYNMLWANKLPLSLFDLPHALGRKQHRKWNRKNKRMLGRSIEERPAIAVAGTEIGHGEVDTVVGRRQGREAVIFTAVEKVLCAFILPFVYSVHQTGYRPIFLHPTLRHGVLTWDEGNIDIAPEYVYEHSYAYDGVAI